MIFLIDQIENKFCEPWTTMLTEKKLAILTVIAGELLAETDTKNDLGPRPQALMYSSAQICLRMTSLGQWVRPINHQCKLQIILIPVSGTFHKNSSFHSVSAMQNTQFIACTQRVERSKMRYAKTFRLILQRIK